MRRDLIALMRPEMSQNVVRMTWELAGLLGITLEKAW